MTTTKRGDWQRVNKSRPCPVCGKADWCIYAGPDDAPEAAICARVESPKRIAEAGWLHKLRKSATAWPKWRSTFKRAVRLADQARPETLDFGRLVTEAQRAVRPEQLERFARDLGVTPKSLRQLGVGWFGDKRAWGFPMWPGGDGYPVGVRLRLPNGKKLSIKGGHEGLFIPADLQPGRPFLITEGPTDTAACLDWGFRVVGRPNCTGGTRHLIETVRNLAPREVAIMADGDEPGRNGAERLAASLVAYVPTVRVIAPPAGTKDARAWKRAGATARDVQEVIDAAEPWRIPMKVTAKAGGRNGRR